MYLDIWKQGVLNCKPVVPVPLLFGRRVFRRYRRQPPRTIHTEPSEDGDSGTPAPTASTSASPSTSSTKPNTGTGKDKEKEKDNNRPKPPANPTRPSTRGKKPTAAEEAAMEQDFAQDARLPTESPAYHSPLVEH
ncbi:hypothetical protein D9611_013897 [Ephemerocybe angulata]|uniref:Uncharacterized protein n=1 Tax=Ephemerocybe angulata TaxID=980116 RepID=A0A8H5BA24_9AGAR|nr:hypothetical protein D9611_013897 [Tulosesus angulatus]